MINNQSYIVTLMALLLISSANVCAHVRIFFTPLYPPRVWYCIGVSADVRALARFAFLS